MERAIRAVSVERGYDPRDFALVAFGGCGGLHACEMADDLGNRHGRRAGDMPVCSPRSGMLMADRVRDYTAGVDWPRSRTSGSWKSRRGKTCRRLKLERYYDMRYVGQSYELTIPEGASFHAAHRKMYGYSDESRATEVVAIRVRAVERCSENRNCESRPKTKAGHRTGS